MKNKFVVRWMASCQSVVSFVSFLSRKRIQNAESAYKKALLIKPNDLDIMIDYAKILTEHALSLRKIEKLRKIETHRKAIKEFKILLKVLEKQNKSLENYNFLISQCYQFLGSHPLIKKEKRLKELYDKAESALSDLYQAAGHLEFDKTKNR